MTIAAGIKLLIFTIVSILVTGLLAAIMGNFGFGDSTEYQAVFSNASMLEKGDDVRVAGVSVGEVKKVEHYKRNQALVTFRVKSDVPLTTTSRAEIRFLNLVGDRYLALEAGDETGDALPDGMESRRRRHRRRQRRRERAQHRHPARGRRHHPGRPDHAGARPDRRCSTASSRCSRRSTRSRSTSSA